MISGKAKLAGIMGWPVSHSRSPKLHEYWLRQNTIDGVYIPLCVKPEELEKALRALPILGFSGCNLTVPHKQSSLKYMDHIDPLARRVGAVNTVVVREDGMLEGRNTDVYGFQENLKTAGFYVSENQKTATVLGAGGAARAVIVALQIMGFEEIRLVNRTREHAEKCRASFMNDVAISIFSWKEIPEALEKTSLLVNTTSLGMTGQPGLTLDLTPLPSTAWVTDIVYTPLITSLLCAAKQRGISTVDGLGMLLYQAQPGFEAWFGALPEVTNNLRQYVLGDE